MAPLKNPNCKQNIKNSSATNGNTNNNNNSNNNNNVAGTTPTTTTTNSTTTRKTGAVPKVSATTSASSIPESSQSTSAQAQANLQNRCSPLNIVQEHQQSQSSTLPPQQQQQQPVPQRQLRKNTEVVAPIRREEFRDFKALNDYIYAQAAARTPLCMTGINTNSNNNTNGINNTQTHKQKIKLQNQQQQQQQQNSQNNSYQTQQLQPSSYPHSNLQQQQQYLNDQYPTPNNGSLNNTYDIENIQENQRFCYPVRPIPRGNQQLSTTPTTVTVAATQQISNSNNLNQSNHAATICVVVPNTPGSENNTNNATTNAAIVNTTTEVATTSRDIGREFIERDRVIRRWHKSLLSANVNDFSDSILTQRVRLMQDLLRFREHSNTNNTNQNNNNLSETSADIPNETPSCSNSVNLRSINTATAFSPKSCNKNQKTKMVHGSNTNTNENNVINSVSLEDVANSEMGDARAQSIHSLHSVYETPTPDTSPSFEELQQRLDTSNRNIQNMQEQQQQLLRLQNAAKQHLNEMETLRQAAGQLSFNPHGGAATNGSDNNNVPQYESIGQVHSDMANLVDRMKNLTIFIQNQNELGNLLGDEGPEILAEQVALQKKLESLRAQRDEMRNIVEELVDVNRNAEKVNKDRLREKTFDKDNVGIVGAIGAVAVKKETNTERIVPIEYTRHVPIEMLPTTNRSNNSNNELEIAPDLMAQKVADIAMMKKQLAHLKEMMTTVNLIEDRAILQRQTAPSEPLPVIPQQREIYVDRDLTPTANYNHADDIDDRESTNTLSNRARLLHDVTSDLRDHAAALQQERQRIIDLQEDIRRRKEQAAAAAQLGEDALQRHSLTPTPIRHVQNYEQTQAERDQLKVEYELKKKEFELLCQRLQGEETVNTNVKQEIRSDVDNETDDDINNEPDFATRCARQRAAAVATAAAETTQAINEPSANSTQIDSATHSSNATTNVTNVAVNNVQDGGASIEAASIQSDSSRSFSIPPPMPAISTNNWHGTLSSTWIPQSLYGGGAQQTQLNSGPFTPPQFSGSTVVTAAQNNDCACSTTTSAAGISNGVVANSSNIVPQNSVVAATQLFTDPLLMQQFVQTQQMIISNVCQNNQMLWHQQREIENLNNIIHQLQERILVLSASAAPNTADLAFNLRSESVPPPPNNLFASVNRAQSEQPINFVPNTISATSLSNVRSAFTNYQQQQQQQQLQQQQQQLLFQQRQQQRATATGFNYASETQQTQQNTNSTTTNLYSTLNNETPQTTLTAGGTSGPGPIFMHHHNNSIHQNNANLRTQNHYANNIQQQQAQQEQQQQQPQPQQPHNNNVNNTLNNQVPPGNRANNYWDNFRSYSRQNLLSSNSNKSNPFQQQQQLQQLNAAASQATTDYIENGNWPFDTIDELYTNYDLFSNEIPTNNIYAPTSSSAMTTTSAAAIANETDSSTSNIRNLNMNVNYGNSPHFQRNKVPAKPTCHAKPTSCGPIRSRNSYHQRNLGDYGPQQQQQQQQQVAVATILQSNQSPQHYDVDSSASTATIQPTTFTNVRNRCSENDYLLSTIEDIPGNFDYMPTTSVSLLPFTENPNDAIAMTSAVATSTAAQLNGNNDNNNSQAAATNLLSKRRNRKRNGRQFDAESVDNEDEDEDDVVVVDDDEEEDDTTSEEIKRNLLVNALKNDKFTTKFYESIKEDVFRRLESMLLEKENSESAGGGTQQLRSLAVDNELQQQQQQQQQPEQEPLRLFHLYKNVENEHTLDALHKLNLNARMNVNQQKQQQQQQQQQQVEEEQEYEDEDEEAEETREKVDDDDECADQVADCRRLSVTTTNLDGMETELAWIIDESQVGAIMAAERKKRMMRNAETESNGDDVTENPIEMERNLNPENDKPEEDVDIISNQHVDVESVVIDLEQLQHDLDNVAAMEKSRKNVANKESKMLSHSCSAGAVGGVAVNASNGNAIVATTTKSGNRKRKNQRKNLSAEMNFRERLTGAITFQTQIIETRHTEISDDLKPDEDLISYIITRIRNQTHENTIVNDTTLAEIAKITATAAQNTFNRLNLMAATSTAGFAPTLCPTPNITPKRIYSKIKKMSVPKKRDDFLKWYRGYLETIFAVEQQPIIETNEQQHMEMDELQSTIHINNTMTVTSAITNMEVNDADLAEADQICSANSSNAGGATLQLGVDINMDNALLLEQLAQINENTDTNESRAIETANAASGTHDFDFVNNENPDEDEMQIIGLEEGAYSLNASDSTVALGHFNRHKGKSSSSSNRELRREFSLKRNSIA